jgi:hypothetical protein
MSGAKTTQKQNKTKTIKFDFPIVKSFRPCSVDPITTAWHIFGLRMDSHHLWMVTVNTINKYWWKADKAVDTQLGGGGDPPPWELGMKQKKKTHHLKRMS